jgi:tRNA (cytosine38-C5)-methyltransferase
METLNQHEHEHEKEQEQEHEHKEGLKMIEFFSGIGGMRYGIHDAIDHHNNSNNNNSKSKAKVSLQSCIAYEISLYANQTYSLNFDEPISSFKNDKRSNSTRTNKRARTNRNNQNNNNSNNDSNNSNDSNNQSKIKNNKNNNKPFAIYTKLIEQLQPQDVHNVDLWTMSPPCQPFTNTRHAKQNDSLDERCKGFKAIIDLLYKLKIMDDDGDGDVDSDVIHDNNMDDNGNDDNDNKNEINKQRQQKRPKWILLENVKGFHGSDMLNQWYKCLTKCGYTYQEYILNPTQFGIPNNRRRYYMLAECSNRFSLVDNHDGAGIIGSGDGGVSTDDMNSTNVSYRTNVPNGKDSTTIQPLSDYIQKEDESTHHNHERYIIPDHIYDKQWAKDLPVVCSLDRITHCFTAGYGRQIHRATGSLLLMNEEEVNDNENNHGNGNMSIRTKSIADQPLDRSDMTIYKGKLRRFTENELVSIFGFPSTFHFPNDLSLEHRYKLIGNSVNVKVISYLLRYLIFDT